MKFSSIANPPSHPPSLLHHFISFSHKNSNGNIITYIQIQSDSASNKQQRQRSHPLIIIKMTSNISSIISVLWTAFLFFSANFVAPAEAQSAAPTDFPTGGPPAPTDFPTGGPPAPTDYPTGRTPEPTDLSTPYPTLFPKSNKPTTTSMSYDSSLSISTVTTTKAGKGKASKVTKGAKAA